MANRIRFTIRSDSTEHWRNINPVLSLFEAAYDTTVRRLKFGDGIHKWTELPYMKPDVIDNLTSTSIDDALSANMGKYLKALHDTLRADHEELKAAHNKLRNKFDALKSDYAVVKADHYTLKDSHNALQADHNALKLVVNTKASQADLDALSSVVKTKASKTDLTNHINSKNPHPNWKPDLSGTLSFSDITGNLDASRITGNLTGITIDASKVTNLKSFVESLIPDDSGGGGGSTGFSGILGANGYVKLPNGLMLQWATRFINNFTGEGKYSAAFPVSFEYGCYGLSADIVFDADDIDIDANSWVQILQSTITKSGFAYRIQSADSTPYKYTIGVKFIAIGV